MISSLEGKLDSMGNDWAIINVNGIGFQVYMPASTLSDLGMAGNEVKVYTRLYLRDDNVTLYGFGSAEELWLFERLIGVTGLGPRLALAMLSALSAEQLSMAIATGNADLLTVVPGIGKKVAGRIVLELREKIGAGLAVSTTTPLAQENTDVLAALSALGYSATEAARALATLPPESKLSLEDKIKLALQYFAQK